MSVPLPSPGQGGGADRRDACRRRGRGGAAVVLRGRESRSHGEGRQRVSQGRSCNARRRAGESRRRADGRAPARQARSTARYGRCRPSCTAGREKIPPAGSVICSTSFATRSSWPRRGNASRATPGRGRRGSTGPRWPTSRTGSGSGAFLEQIRDSLKSGEFRPVPVRQVMIPKTSGKLRKLGIPTVTDRVVQAALKLVLEPIFEADFQPCSYGFRPNRRAHDAIAEIHYFTTQRIPLGAGGRHQGMLRRNRACPPDGPAPGKDQGQAGAARWSRRSSRPGS